MMNNSTTRRIVEELCKDYCTTHNQLIIKEFGHLNKKRPGETSADLIKQCEEKIEKIESEGNEKSNPETAQAIKYLIRTNKVEHMNIFRRLLHWQHS